MENISLKYDMNTFNLSIKIDDKEFPKDFLITGVDIHIDAKSIPEIKLSLEALSLDVNIEGQITVNNMAVIKPMPDVIRRKIIEILSSGEFE